MSNKFSKKDLIYEKKTIIYTTDSPLICLAVHPKAEMVAVAGRNIFQVFSVQEDKFVSLHRVKTPSRLIMSDVPITKAVTESSGTECGPNPAPGTIVSVAESIPPRHSPIISSTINQPRSHSVSDVSWSSVGDILATASTSGDVMLWDVGRGMTQTACFSGHNRSIHCIHFNPTISTELVTASQDGKLKLFDIRDPNPNSSCRIFFQRNASPSPVRDVSFCPKQGFLVAAVQENGVISIWDTRKGSRPFRAFQGHSCSITTLDWHPNWNVTSCNWLATAGARDHLIKVWNLSSSSGQGSVTCPNVIYTVRTTNVNRVRWRPTFMTQLVSSCNLTIDLSVHVWDLQRPFIPYASFEEHKDLVTCISWCPAETNNFYTIGRDGLLIRHSIRDGVRPAENAAPVALSLSPYGHLLHAVSKDRVEISKKLSITEKSSVTYPPIYNSMKNHDQMMKTLPVHHLNGNGFPPGYYASSNSTSSSVNYNATSNGPLTSTDSEIPIVPVASIDAEEVVEVTITSVTHTVAAMTVNSEPNVTTLTSNNNTINNTSNVTNITTISPVAVSTTYATSPVNDCVITTTAAKTLPTVTNDLPQMGSLKSAKLFVSQRHSLMFHYEPCLELVQFWILLRSVYGSLGSDKRTSQQHASQPHPPPQQQQGHQMVNMYSRSDLEPQHSKTVQCSLASDNTMVRPVDSLYVHNHDNKTSLKYSQYPERKKCKQLDVNTPSNSTGVRLSYILETLGFRDREPGVTQKKTSKFKLDYRRHSSGNVKVRNHKVAKHLIDIPPVTHRFLSYSGSGGENPSTAFSTLSSSTNPHNEVCLPNLNNELLICTTKSIPVNISYMDMHKALTIDDDQHASSISSSASPPTIPHPQSILRKLEQDISPSGLLFNNYREDMDYLFHPTSPQKSAPLPLVEDNAAKRGPKQLDLIEVIGSHDDPVVMETEYLPDEAFPTTFHPLQQQDQSQCQHDNSFYIHQNKHRKLKQPVVCSSLGETFNNAADEIHDSNSFDVVSCSADASVPKRNASSSKPQRKSMDCTKILTSKCCDLSLVDWGTRQILPASSFPGLPITAVKDVQNAPSDSSFINPNPSDNSGDDDDEKKHKEGIQASKICCNEKKLENADHDEIDQRFISNSSASESNSSSLTKDKSFNKHKKEIQLLAPWLHSKSSSGFDKESTMLLNGHTFSPIGSLSPISGEINAIIGKWFVELVESGHVQTVCTALLALGSERLHVNEWVSEVQLEHWFISYLELLSRFRLWTVCARIMKQCGNPFAGADNQIYLREYRRSINLQYVIRPIVMKPAESESKTPNNTAEPRSEGNTRTRWKSGGIENQFTSRLGNTSPALAPGVAALNQISTTLSIRCGLCTKPLCASESTQRMTGHTGWACSRHATSCDPATITCALCHLVVRGLFIWCRGCSHGGHLDHMQAWLMRRPECPAGCGHRCRYG
ncbi:unnamed protein product [Heterobilharzia americana]|nr:unnamed protein product [Heterobilharzia americana]